MIVQSAWVAAPYQAQAQGNAEDMPLHVNPVFAANENVSDAYVMDMPLVPPLPQHLLKREAGPAQKRLKFGQVRSTGASALTSKAFVINAHARSMFWIFGVESQRLLCTLMQRGGTHAVAASSCIGPSGSRLCRSP